MKIFQRTDNQQFLFYIFLAAWTLFNLLNAAYTGLAHDEAYYWIYGQHLDWGYFDHPPAVAAVIKAGYSLFQNELGVRLLNVLGSSLSLVLLWRLCSRYKEDLKLFVFLVCGIIIFHVYGFIIVPDSPLLIATAVYFWALDRYLTRDNLGNVLFLSFSIAFLLYSKYHGLLILFFTILAYPKLIIKRSFWLTTLCSVLLFFPHIWWQIQNDFLTLRFHLFERVNRPYKFSFTTNYILGVLLISGPLLGFIFWYVIFKVKAASTWERALKYNVLGFVLFFLWSSFSRKIEANWVSPIVIPLLILSYKYLTSHYQLRKWAIRLGAVSLGIALLFRGYALSETFHNTLADNFRIKNEFHGWEEWAGQIQNQSSGKPVVFINSYQQTSKYTFYTGEPAHSYNTIYRRRNQFDLLETEANIQSKKVLVISEYEFPEMEPFETVLGNYYEGTIENFRSYNKVKISPVKDELIFEAGTTYPLEVNMKNNFDFPVNFRENPDYTVQLVISIFRQREFLKEQSFPVKLQKENLRPGESFSQELSFEVPEEKGKYTIYISFKSNWLDPALNYSSQNLMVQ